MNKRLEQFMRAENLSSAKFAEILGVQPSSISHLLSGRNNPNFDFISKLLYMFPTINPYWIINGSGDMYVGVQTSGSSSNSVDNTAVSYKSNDASDTNVTAPKVSDVERVAEFPNVNIADNLGDLKSEYFGEKTLFDEVATSEVNCPLESDNQRYTAPQDVPTPISKPSRSVEKVLLLYKDGTFDFFGSN